ncbi:protein of unknown function [Nitratireductor aquimarinus]
MYLNRPKQSRQSQLVRLKIPTHQVRENSPLVQLKQTKPVTRFKGPFETGMKRLYISSLNN